MVMQQMLPTPENPSDDAERSGLPRSSTTNVPATQAAGTGERRSSSPNQANASSAAEAKRTHVARPHSYHSDDPSPSSPERARPDTGVDTPNSLPPTKPLLPSGGSGVTRRASVAAPASTPYRVDRSPSEILLEADGDLDKAALISGVKKSEFYRDLGSDDALPEVAKAINFLTLMGNLSLFSLAREEIERRLFVANAPRDAEDDDGIMPSAVDAIPFKDILRLLQVSSAFIAETTESVQARVASASRHTPPRLAFLQAARGRPSSSIASPLDAGPYADDLDPASDDPACTTGGRSDPMCVDPDPPLSYHRRQLERDHLDPADSDDQDPSLSPAEIYDPAEIYAPASTDLAAALRDRISSNPGAAAMLRQALADLAER